MTYSLPVRPGVYRLLVLTILFFAIGISHVSAQNPAIIVRADLPDGLRMQQISYGNGIYLACSVYPRVLYRSTDAVAWSRVATGPDLGFDTGAISAQRPFLAYGAGRFVVTADSGKISSSADGLTWTATNTGNIQKFQSVQFLNDTFYVVGDSAMLLTSPDGLSWTPQHIGLGSSFDSYQGITYGNGLLVIESWYVDAPDNVFFQTIYRSSHGMGGPWTPDTLSFIQAGNIRFLKDHFYKLGPAAQVSTDAHNWMTLLYQGTDTLSVSEGFTDSSSVYLVPANDIDSPGTLVRAADGLHFDSTIRTPESIQQGAYLGQHYFAYGFKGINASTDGVHYHVLGSSRNSVASNGSNYVKLTTNTEASILYSSSDFTHWTPRDTLKPGIREVIYDGAQYITGLDTVYTSPDGISWSKKGLSNVSLANITYGGGVYVISGADQTGAAGLFYSTDAVNWTSSTLPDLTEPRGPPKTIGTITKIRYINGHFFVLTANSSAGTGLRLSSDDGITFRFIGTGFTLSYPPRSYNDIVYDSDSAKYYLMGTITPGGGSFDQRRFFSIAVVNPFDSLTPIDPSLSTVNGLPAGAQVNDGPDGLNFSYSHGHFVGSVADMTNALGPDIPLNSYLLWSSDGLHWDSYSIQGYTSITSTIASADSFRMEGINNYEILVNFAGSGGPLPITLLDFEARAQNNTSVGLSWKTALEQNSRGFRIQRSTAAADFADIGFVPAAGNSDKPLSYVFTDGSPAPGYNDYRLLMTDLDGTYQASPIRRVWIGASGKITVFPNPAADYLTIEGFTTATGMVTLYDATGKEMGKKDFNGSSLTLSLKDYPAGVYYLFIRLKDGSEYRESILH